MNTFLTLLLTLLSIPSQYRMMVISDPHVLDQSLFNVNSAAMQAKMANDLDQSEYAQAAFTQLVDKALTDNPDVVLIPGDMTKNGSRVSHDAVAKQLRRLTDANIKVCLIPGENDINNSNAASYLGATPQSVPSISSAEFDSIYAFTKQAFPNRRDDPNSHSYVLTLAPRLTLIGADCTVGSYSGDAGVFTESTLNWILAQADSAKAKGDRVMAMMHYQLMEHTDGFAAVAPFALVENYETVAKIFRAHGIELVLTGHMHIDNVSALYTTSSRDSIVEISTGTPIMYPNPYRMITVTGERDQFTCSTNYLTSLTANPVFTVDNNKNHVKYTIQNVLVPSYIETYWAQRGEIDGIIEKIDLGSEVLNKPAWAAMKGVANKLINAVPDSPSERAAFVNKYCGESLTNAAFIHLEGNEGDNPNSEAVKNSLFPSVRNLAFALVDEAYSTKIAQKTAKNTLDKYVFDKYSNDQQVVDALDGFFGDYTYYKKDNQNRTDDLTPNLRFAQLPHRDYYATVTFDLGGYGSNFVQKVLINDPAKITRPTDPTFKGWYFVNWYSDPELTQLYDFNTEISAFDDVSMTLYAKWIPVITFTLGDVKKMYDGTPVAPLYKMKGSLPKNCKEQVEVDTIITNVDSLTYHVTSTTIWKGTEDVTANYHIEWANTAASMVITPRAIAIATATTSGIYNGVALTAQDTTMSGDGFIAGEGIDITYTGSQTYVGTSNNTITYEAQGATKLNNYNISVVPGTLTIAPAALSIALRDTTKMYDGDTLRADYIIEGNLAAGDEVKVYLSNNEIVDAGFVIVNLDSVVILNALEENVTAQYTITQSKPEFTLTITKRAITIISASDSVEYNGYPLTAESVEYIGNFAEGEGVTIFYYGEQTDPGTSDNEFEYEANLGTDLSNYEITTVYGTLTVSSRPDTPTILISPSVVEQVEKVIINETLYIRKGGVLYDAAGKVVIQ